MYTQKTVLRSVAALVAICSMIIASTSYAYTTVFFGPGTYNADTATMDATLGISGWQIEDFEDVNLISGLSYTLEGGITTATYTELPNTLSHPSIEYWSGKGLLSNAVENSCPGLIATCGAPISDRLTFNLPNGTEAVGVGLVSFQSLSTHTLLINGQSIGTIELLGPPEFVLSILGRNAYVLISRELGDDPLESIGFENATGPDILFFDHVAVSAVPLPAALPLATVVLVGLWGTGRRKIRVC